MPARGCAGPGGLNAPSGAGCSLTTRSTRSRSLRPSCLNAPSGAGCSLTVCVAGVSPITRRLNAPSGAGCSLTPASGSRVVATFPGAGSPPALRGPSGGGRNGSISTTFRWYDATRHRRPRERIRRRLWTRPCGKVAVERGVLHHTNGDQDHRFGQPQPWLSTPRAPARAPSPLDRSPRYRPPSSSTGAVP